MGVRWQPVLGGVAVLALVRCSSFDEETPVTPLADAATDASTSGGDAAEGGLVDAGLVDARAEGGSACLSTHSLCDDFDRDGGPFDPSRWSQELGTAPHAIDGTRVLSPPGSFVAAIEDAGSSYLLEKSISGPVKAIRCAVGLYIEDTGGDYGLPLGLVLTGGAPGYQLDLNLRPKTDDRPAWVQEGLRVTEIGKLAPGVWHRIVIDTPPLRVRINDVEVANVGPTDGGADGTTPFSNAIVRIGAQSNTSAPGWRLRFDDVVCDKR
ncbi:MAG: hypothetical protein JST00_01315 [Deltaproteobacteria bacterium]|nr:hypothetical protein [Deltaproteobacteria bacterium]